MNSAVTIDPNITMRELLEHFPGAQRALFRRYHIGGCSSCGFSPDETLAGVCARNENLNVDEVVEHILVSHEADRTMQIEPRELADHLAAGEQVQLLDIRTREEFDAVKLPNAQLLTAPSLAAAGVVARKPPRHLRSQGRAKHGRGGIFPRPRFRKHQEFARRNRRLERRN